MHIQTSLQGDWAYKDAANSVQPLQPDVLLHKACQQLCQELPNLIMPELGYLKDFKLDIKFKSNVIPV